MTDTCLCDLPFKVGDRVVMEAYDNFRPYEPKGVVRTVTCVGRVHHPYTDVEGRTVRSMVAADGGQVCRTCGCIARKTPKIADTFWRMATAEEISAADSVPSHT